MKKMVFFLLTMILLGACAPRIIKGTVVEKRHEPEETSIVMRFRKVNGISYPYFVEIYDDEDWVAVVKQDNEEISVFLEKEEWEKVEIGDPIKLENPQIYVETP